MSGYSKEELLNTTIPQLEARETQNEVGEHMKIVIEKGWDNFETRHRRKDGSTYEVLVSVTYNSKRDEFYCYISNVTNGNRIKKELERVNSELEKERDLFSFGPVIVTVWLLKPGWPLKYASGNIVSILGYTQEQWNSKDFYYKSIIHFGDIEMVTRIVDSNISNKKELYELSYRIKKMNGEYIWVYDYGKIRRDEVGTPTEVHGYMFEQTQLKKAIKELEDSELKYRTVANYTYNWEYWIQGRNFIYISPSVERITGYKVGEFMNNPCMLDEIVFEEDRIEWLNHRCKMARCFDPQTIDFRIVCRDGTNKWINQTCRVIIDENGKYMGIRASNRDISLTKELEFKLVNNTISVEESERSRYSRELHDGLGPLLATIKLYFQWLSETNEKEKAKMLVEKGLLNTEKAIETTRQISRGLSPLHIDNEGFVNSFQSFIDDLSINSKVNITFDTNLSERLYRTIEITLYRISTELVNNSLKYADATSILVSCEIVPEKKTIHFTYKDNGKGFNVQEQFKASKGLGIPNIQSRVKALGGLFGIESGEGMGAKVIIELPYIVNEIVNN